MRIGLAYNQRPDLTDTCQPATTDAYVEWDEPETIAAVQDALGAFGDVVLLEAIGDFPARLADARVDLLFNMAEGTSGPHREAQVPAIAEFLGVRYTASGPLTLALALHKALAKDVFRQRGIPTPPFTLIETLEALELLEHARYPVFLKPVWEGSSKGIGLASYAETAEAAWRRTRELLVAYHQPVLAEAYLPG